MVGMEIGWRVIGGMEMGDIEMIEFRGWSEGFVVVVGLIARVGLIVMRNTRMLAVSIVRARYMVAV